ncbi:ABC transporter permease [Lysinibacillus sp. LZ02]|uniref:ABC transporter permease n=1 Tax=Lysinibacillus sp. LZ02 TaxID=3420668 RepID=UPI003D36E68B
MFNLKAIALKLFRAASTQVLTSIGIISVSICLLMTMSVYIWNAHAQMEEEMYAIFGDADMLVGYNPEQKMFLTNDTLQEFSQIDGVTELSPILLAHTNVEGVLPSVYTMGVENDNLVKSRYHFTEDLVEGEVIISQNIADMFDKSVGDTIELEFEAYTIKEVLPPLLGASEFQMVILPNATVKKWLPTTEKDVAGLFTLIQTDGNTDYMTLTMNFQQIDRTLRVDITSEYEVVKANFQALAIFMIVLSVFVLLITAMLLLSTFQLVFYKIKGQLMVLRSLGATSEQVGKIVQLQLVMIIGVGAILGTCLNVVLMDQWLPLMIEKMQLPAAKTDIPVWLVLCIGIGISVILYMASQWQVQKSMRLLPMQIASENAETTLKWTKGKLAIMSFVFIVALLCMLNGIAGQGGGDGALLILIGALMICLLALYSMPFVFSAILKALLRPVRVIFGKEAYLACQQLMPQIRKNMPIILSIIGLMVILVFGTTLFKTGQQSGREYLERTFETPIILKNEIYDATFTLDVVDEIKSLPSVDAVYAKSNWLQVKALMNEGATEEYPAVQMVDLQQLMDIGKLPVVQGDLTRGIFVTEQFAAHNDLSMGDQVDLQYFDWEIEDYTPVGSLEVLAVVPDSSFYADFFIDWSSVIPIDEHILVQEVMVQTTDIEQTLQELAFIKSEWPALTIKDEQTSIEEYNKMFYQRWSLFVSVMVVLIVATCLGVIQTLLHTIYSKRSDYAIQRLVGLSPNGLMKLILTQVLSFIVYGLAVGCLIGVLLTELLALIDKGSPIIFDVRLLVLVSSGFILAVVGTFVVQGFMISRKKLANELLD